MGTKNDWPGFRGTVAIGDDGGGENLTDPGYQQRAHGRRTHAQELDGGEIRFGEQRLFLQHPGNHRRHRGEPGTPEALDRLDIGGRGELWQEHDGRMPGAGELGEREGIHVVERGGNQQAVPRHSLPLQASAHDPEVTVMRQNYALWLPS
jgi:hypothetical protein